MEFTANDLLLFAVILAFFTSGYLLYKLVKFISYKISVKKEVDTDKANNVYMDLKRIYTKEYSNIVRKYSIFYGAGVVIVVITFVSLFTPLLMPFLLDNMKLFTLFCTIMPISFMIGLIIMISATIKYGHYTENRNISTEEAKLINPTFRINEYVVKYSVLDTENMLHNYKEMKKDGRAKEAHEYKSKYDGDKAQHDFYDNENINLFTHTERFKVYNEFYYKNNLVSVGIAKTTNYDNDDPTTIDFMGAIISNRNAIENGYIRITNRYRYRHSIQKTEKRVKIDNDRMYKTVRLYTEDLSIINKYLDEEKINEIYQLSKRYKLKFNYYICSNGSFLQIESHKKAYMPLKRSGFAIDKKKVFDDLYFTDAMIQYTELFDRFFRNHSDDE